MNTHFTREQLEGMNKTEISEICKNRGIARYKGKVAYKKDELIHFILEKQDLDVDIAYTNKQIEEAGEHVETRTEVAEIEEANGTCSEEKSENTDEVIAEISDIECEEHTGVESIIKVAKNKAMYIETAKPGTLIAFRHADGKLDTAKIIKIENNEFGDIIFFVETAYRCKFVISASSVEWVKTGSRWPKKIYLELKGRVA